MASPLEQIATRLRNEPVLPAAAELAPLGKSSSRTIRTFVEDLAVLVEEAPKEQLDALEDDGTPLLRVQGGAVERRDLVARVRFVHRLLELVGAAEDLVLGEGLVVHDRSHRA